MSVFQMELNYYPHFNLTEDGRLCSMGQHCSGFLRVLYNALVRLGYDAILRSDAHPPSEHDRELQEVYHRRSNAEHGWNHTCMLLNIAREEVDICTHEIVHLEHHMEAQDAELKERAEMIANLERQLLELQV
jgi:hypothetical protein